MNAARRGRVLAGGAVRARARAHSVLVLPRRTHHARRAGVSGRTFLRAPAARRDEHHEQRQRARARAREQQHFIYSSYIHKIDHLFLQEN